MTNMLPDCLGAAFGGLGVLWQTANQKRCYALLRTGRRAELSEEYRYMDMGDAAKQTAT